jgi:hypothetical protein
VLSWLLMGLLVIIWGFFLLPTRGRSPAASVEEFEQGMTLLAETNKDAPGRWVLMPRHRFLDPTDRARARVLRRRRTIFLTLLEAVGFFALIGLVPPLRAMLLVAGALAFVLLVYSAVLVQVKSAELQQARRAMRRRAVAAGAAGRPSGSVALPESYAPEAVYRGAGNGPFERSYGSGFSAGRTNGNGHRVGSNGHAAVNGNGHGGGVLPNGSAGTNGNGHAVPSSVFDDGTLELIDDDVHVIIRRAGDMDREAVVEAASAGSSRSATGR